MEKDKNEILTKYSFMFQDFCDYILDVDMEAEEYVRVQNKSKLHTIVNEGMGAIKELYKFAKPHFLRQEDSEYIEAMFNRGDVVEKARSGVVESREFLLKDFSDQCRWKRIVFYYRIEQEKPHIILAVTDITKMKKKEELDLLQQQYLYAAVFNIYPLVASIDVTNNKFSTIRFEEYTQKQSGKIEMSLDEVIELAVSQIHPDDVEGFLNKFSRKKQEEAFLDGAAQIYYEFRFLGVDGKYHWGSLLSTRIFNQYDDELCQITFGRYMDDEKQTEQNLRDALYTAEEASNAKSDFLSNMSHEIRTPMNAIIGMTELAKTSDDMAYVRECIGKIENSAQYLLTLINDILDMSKIEHNQVIFSNEIFCLEELVSNIYTIIEPQARSKNIHFKIKERGITVRYYYGDTLRVKQILINLLSNALKFTDKGGTVQLKIIETHKNEDSVFLGFIVKDTGIGMSPEFLEKMYQPFVQERNDRKRNKSGTGLGLSIAKNLVGLMDGHMQVESKLGVGTKFQVELKLKIATKEEEERKENTQKPLENVMYDGKRVLLVEDNELNQEIAVALLEKKHILVECASDGQEAIEMFKTKEPYDLILMDIMMPVKDGLEATKEIRSIPSRYARNVPIVAMTANAFSTDIAKSLAHGMNDHLVKPINIRHLNEILDKYLNLK